MKLLLKISIALIVLAVGLAGFSYTLPKEAVVKQSIIIKASPEKVFQYLNNPADWKRWNAWNKAYDPTLIYMYGGPLTGKGARQSWNGDKTGNWQMIFTESVAPDSLTYQIKQDGAPFVTNGGFYLEETAAGTSLTWYQRMPIVDNPIALYKGAWQKNETEQQIQLGLTNLQTLISDTKNNTAKR